MELIEPTFIKSLFIFGCYVFVAFFPLFRVFRQFLSYAVYLLQRVFRLCHSLL